MTATRIDGRNNGRRIVDNAQAESWVRKHLIELIEIKSTSTQEHRVGDHLERLANELDLPVRRQPVSGSGDNVLIGAADPTLLLTAHMDTVVPTWEWSGVATVVDDRVYGLGAQDDKGCIVACLLAFVIARDEGMDLSTLPVLIGLTVDEEEDGTGSMAMANSVRPPFVIAVEGTDFKVCTEEGGTVEAWIELSGTTCHGAMPENGENAIHKAIELVNTLRALPIMNTPHPLIGPNVLSVLGIAGGSDLFVIPDTARVHVDVRVGGVGESALVLAALGETCARYDAKLELIESVEPFAVSPYAPLVQALRASASAVRGTPSGLMGMPAWTDAHSFAEVGCEAVVFGPGSLRVAHLEDEWISVREIVTCARVFVDMFRNLDQLVPGA
ncbi:MAG: peptidase [Marmoricola sp.]|nr:peptidase [Marmoricola sp.]